MGMEGVLRQTGREGRLQGRRMNARWCTSTLLVRVSMLWIERNWAVTKGTKLAVSAGVRSGLSSKVAE